MMFASLISTEKAFVVLTCHAKCDLWSTFGQYLKSMMIFVSVYFELFRIFRFTSDITRPGGCVYMTDILDFQYKDLV